MEWEMREEMQKTACAVIFDMDGTLFDTEVIYGRAWIKAGLTKEQYYQLIGRSRVNIDKILTDWGYDLEKVRAVRSSAVEKELEEQRGLSTEIIDLRSGEGAGGAWRSVKAGCQGMPCVAEGERNSCRHCHFQREGGGRTVS